MGQIANGILYGCEAPELSTDDNPERLYDLICRWEKAKKIDRFARDVPRICYENEGDKDLLGVWVAVGGSGEDGAPYFLETAMLLFQVATHYQKSIAKAEKLWKRFANYVAKTEKIELPAPALWLTPCETA